MVHQHPFSREFLSMTMRRTLKLTLITLVATVTLLSVTDAGVIKDIFQKITNTNEKADDVVKQSSPICGSGIFATPNEKSLSPEFIFITSRPSSSQQVGSSNQRNGRRRESDAKPVAKEFRFHAENVTLQELEQHGFNRDGPVTILMHGFTSGYPLQAWITAIVESYTIDRESSGQQAGNQYSEGLEQPSNHLQGGHTGGESYYHGPEEFPGYHGTSSHNQNQFSRNRRDSGDDYYGYDGNGKRVKHNLFVINWNYAARGIIYPRAVANIPIVATYATRFINDKLIGEARIDSYRIQLIGHSLGAHLAGFIGKNTKSKIGRIYGLDPAGPCFGTLSGSLYPSSKRLAPTDAEEVITVQTNSALLGIDKPLGKYSVFVEGGSSQPGCKGGGVFKSISALTFDGDDFDDIACSHSRAPNLLTYRLDQSSRQESCQMVAYECKSWEAFTKGRCGVCRSGGESSRPPTSSDDPYQPVECYRIGLDWQYSRKQPGGGAGSNFGGASTSDYQRPTATSDYDNNGRNPTRRPSNSGSSNSQYDSNEYGNSGFERNTTTRRPNSGSSQNDYNNDHGTSSSSSNNRNPSRRPNQGGSGSQYGGDNENYGSSSSYDNNQNPSRRPNQHGSSSDNSQYDNHDNNGTGSSSSRNPGRRPTNSGSNSNSNSNLDTDIIDDTYVSGQRNPTRRPSYNTSSTYDRENYGPYNSGSSNEGRRPNRPRPNSGFADTHDSYSAGPNYGNNYNNQYENSYNPHQGYNPYRRNKRAASNRQGRQNDDSIKPISMYLRTVDTQPYCTFHYQVILELQEPFPKNKRPPMSILIQDAEPEHGSRPNREQNSLSNDNFGEKYNDRIYTHLITSVKKIKKPDHATLLFREGLPDGHRILKSLTVNYMSNADPEVRRRFSTRLCLVKKDVHHNEEKEIAAGNRYYFEDCEHPPDGRPNSSSFDNHSNGNHRPNSSNFNDGSRPIQGSQSSSNQRPINSNNGYQNDQYRPNQNGNWNRPPSNYHYS